MAKASAAAAAAVRAARRQAALLLEATANPDGPGLLLRGREHQPVLRADLHDVVVSTALIRLARLAESIAEALQECPDAAVRRSAAVLAARAHPLRVALTDD